MGWTFGYASRDEIVAEQTGSVPVLEHHLHVVNAREAELYMLVQTPRGLTVYVTLIEHQPAMKWGYKSMAESEGPYFHHAPVEWLPRLMAPEGYAAEWRAGVRNANPRRAARRA